MFGLGFGEIILMVFFILVFFGSKEIPNLARTVAKIINQVKHASNELKQEISSSIDTDDLKHKIGIDDIKKEIDQAKNSITKPLEQSENQIKKTVEDFENLVGPIKRQR